MAYRAEYIWVDGTKPTAQLRSKTKILKDGAELPIWGFDGPSPGSSTGDKSDCVLRPVFSCPDPIRGGDDLLVMAEVLYVNMTPHETNTRAAAAAAAEKYASMEPMFGLEQEYTLYKDGRPYGFPEGGYPGPQGPYYCGVGADKIFGRELVEAHTDACLEAGLGISGTNAEVMPGQWEFQVGPLGTLEVADQLWIARWLLDRLGEEFGITVSYDAKPVKGDWNGAGCHTNFSTKAMREDGGWAHIIAGCEALGKKTAEHIAAYGHDIESRLTGAHETQRYDQFSYGTSDRGASIRIPWQCEIDQKGYLEDRRPNGNCDPYLVTRMMVETICGDAAK